MKRERTRTNSGLALKTTAQEAAFSNAIMAAWYRVSDMVTPRKPLRRKME